MGCVQLQDLSALIVCEIFLNVSWSILQRSKGSHKEAKVGWTRRFDTELSWSCGTWKFITLFTNVHHWTVIWAWCIHSTPLPSLYDRFNSSSRTFIPTSWNGLCLSNFQVKLCVYLAYRPCVLRASSMKLSLLNGAITKQLD
jgi:hypothetical protein